MESALASGLKLWPEPGVRDANRSALNCGDVAVADIAECFIEVDTVIVRKLTFQHDSAAHAVTEPPAQAEVVGLGLGNADVIDKNTRFDTLLSMQLGADCAAN